MEYAVTVRLKPDVLDPEGRAICQTLNQLGYTAIKGVTVAKQFTVTIEGLPEEGRQLVEQMAKDVLANPVAETFEVKRIS